MSSLACSWRIERLLLPCYYRLGGLRACGVSVRSVGCRGATWQEVMLTALSLAFATIPEELPILIAGVLAVRAACCRLIGPACCRLIGPGDPDLRPP